MHRSDGSGTTFIWTNYLSKVSPEWKQKVGENTAVEWPVGIGAKGSEGVSNQAGQIVGALGYVEYAYAMQNNLNYARMINAAGKTVAPTAAAFQAAAAGADWTSAPDFHVIITNAPGDTFVAGRRLDVHPDAIRPGHAAARRLPSNSLIGATRTGRKWPPTSTMFRCRIMSWR